MGYEIIVRKYDDEGKMLEENKTDEFVVIVDQIQGIEEVSAEAPEGIFG